jgi:hypothetical protein
MNGRPFFMCENENYARWPLRDTQDTSDTKDTSDLVIRAWSSTSYAVATVPRRLLLAFCFFEPGVRRVLRLPVGLRVRSLAT